MANKLMDMASDLVSKSAKDNGKFLFISNTVGWVLAGLAHIGGIVTNKELSTEDKKFLIPQEAAECGANIGLLALLTAPALKFVDKLELKGVSPENLPKVKGGLGVLTAIGCSIVANNILSSLIRNKMGAIFQKKAIAEDKSEETVKVPSPAIKDIQAPMQPLKAPEGNLNFNNNAATPMNSKYLTFKGGSLRV